MSRVPNVKMKGNGKIFNNEIRFPLMYNANALKV